MHALADTPPNRFAMCFLRAVRRSLPQLLLATIAAGLAAFLAQSWITPRYRAEARIAWDRASPDAASLEKHAKALAEPERVFAVASALGVQRRPEFTRPEQGPLLALAGISAQPQAEARTSEERVLARLYQRLEVALEEARGTIAVRLTSGDAMLAAQFVNRLVESYVGGPAAPAGLTVASRAEPPRLPIAPRKGATAMLGMAATLLLGLGGILTMEAVRSSRRGRMTGDPLPVPLEVRARTLADARPGFAVMPSAAGVAERLNTLAMRGRGFRTIIAGESPAVDATAVAMKTADELSCGERRVVLVRWSLTGGDVTGRRGPQQPPGLNDLLDGAATFEQLVSRLPQSRAHAIAAGAPARDTAAALDPDRLSLVLDALDEVYEHILIVAAHDDARGLFAAMEGRFDAAVSVAGPGGEAEALTAADNLFLGFEVIDIEIIRVAPAALALGRTALGAAG